MKARGVKILIDGQELPMQVSTADWSLVEKAPPLPPELLSPVTIKSTVQINEAVAKQLFDDLKKISELSGPPPQVFCTEELRQRFIAEGRAQGISEERIAKEMERFIVPVEGKHF